MRIVFLLLLAALETTILSLPLTLVALGSGWPLLLVIVLVGWAADWLTLRAPRIFERPILAAGAFGGLALMLSMSTRAGLGALLPGSNELGQAYLLSLSALYLFWRGTRLAVIEPAGVLTLFGRGGLVFIVLLLLAMLGGDDAARRAALISHLLAYVALGLLATALAHGTEESGGKLGWRWLLTLAVAVLAVMLGGALLSGLLGGEETLSLLQRLLAILLFPFALLGGLITWLFLSLFGEPLSRFVRWLMSLFSGATILEEAQQPAQPNFVPLEGPNDFITALALSATWTMALIPFLILLAVIFLLRGRRHIARPGDEQRESLGLLNALGSDLRDLLGALRNPFARRPAGLRAALAALRGADPTSRVRRAYIRLLLYMERREQPRPAAQTPREFAPRAGNATGHSEAVAGLTAAYERARYHPAGADERDAATAETALRALNQPAPVDRNDELSIESSTP